MLCCFFLMGAGMLAASVTLRWLRPESTLLAVAGVALLLLGCFPTDLADLSTNTVTCGSSARVEPCTLVGRIHNPLSTFVFAPILLTMVSLGVRSRSEARWRGVSRWGVVCGVLAACGIASAAAYLHAAGWHGALWTGLMQRSLVLPVLLWMAGLLSLSHPPNPPPSSE